jgi:hypothetical protein
MKKMKKSKQGFIMNSAWFGLLVAESLLVCLLDRYCLKMIEELWGMISMPSLIGRDLDLKWDTASSGGQSAPYL